MHDAMNNLMDDQASVKVTLRELGIGSAPGQRRDGRFSRNEDALSTGVEKSKDRGSAQGMSNVGDDFHIERPADRDPAAAKTLNRIMGRGAHEMALLCRGGHDIDGGLRASLRLHSVVDP